MSRSPAISFLGTMIFALFASTTPVRAELRLTLTVTGNGNPTETETLSTNSGGNILANGDFGIYVPSNQGFVLPFDGFAISNLTVKSTLSTRTLTINASSVMNTGSGGTLTITASDDGEKTPGSFGLNLSSNATVTGNPGVVTFQSFAGNSINDTATFPYSQKLVFDSSVVGPTYSGPGAGSQNAPVASGFHPSGSTFSITNVSTFQLAQNQEVGTMIGNSIVSTPEPATLAMVMAGLPVAGLAAWRKRRSTSA